MMPFSCRVAGGQPVLTPSADEAYEILGQREQRSFTACSPVSPDVCRQWTLHRFDVDCGGVRVPWVSVATAADGPGNGRAWVEDGRVRIRMGPWWNIAPGDPCARQPMYGDRWQSGRFSRYCADRRAAMPPPVVELPFGFAPMLGTKGVFVAAAGPRPGVSSVGHSAGRRRAGTPAGGPRRTHSAPTIGDDIARRGAQGQSPRRPSPRDKRRSRRRRQPQMFRHLSQAQGPRQNQRSSIGASPRRNHLPQRPSPRKLLPPRSRLLVRKVLRNLLRMCRARSRRPPRRTVHRRKRQASAPSRLQSTC